MGLYRRGHNHLFLPSLRDLQRCIDADIIIRSFLRCGISNTVDGSEDDEIRDEIPRDIEADITDGAHNEEDPDADIDELDFFSDED